MVLIENVDEWNGREYVSEEYNRCRERIGSSDNKIIVGVNE